MKQKILTIFTPTYNRGYILKKLYESLCKQTCRDFEWLIVDDGSLDNTNEMVQEWIEEKKIDICYYRQENGGKQRAHNLGVEKANTELFVCVDSDDYVLPEFVRCHLEHWKEVQTDSTVGGMISLQGHNEKTPMGTFFPDGLKRTTLTKLYTKLKFRGDATLVHRTQLLREYPFVVDEGEKFIGEGFVYYQIDQKYCLAIIPQILMIKAYLPDGYTRNVRKLTKDNPKSYVRLKRQTILFSQSWYDRFIQTILYMVGCIMSKESRPICSAPYKGLALLAYFPDWIVWILFYKNA